MPETAMRDADGNLVFVNTDGSYSETFPKSSVVRVNSTRGEESKYRVFGFVGEHPDYESESFEFEDESDAREFATNMYGSENVDGFQRDGEVFGVEVHEIDRDD
jgi:hypothetical protein